MTVAAVVSREQRRPSGQSWVVDENPDTSNAVVEVMQRRGREGWEGIGGGGFSQGSLEGFNCGREAARWWLSGRGSPVRGNCEVETPGRVASAVRRIDAG